MAPMEPDLHDPLTTADPTVATRFIADLFPKKLHLTNLQQNPIVKVTWSAYDSNEENWDFLARMSGLEIVQKDGTVGATCRALSLHILAR